MNDTKGIKSKRGLSYRTDRASNKDARSQTVDKAPSCEGAFLVS